MVNINLLYLQQKTFFQGDYMTEYEKIPLFKGVSENEIKEIVQSKKKYSKGSYVLREGETTGKFGILISGELSVINEDYFGNRNYINKISEGSTFAESFAFAENSVLTVSAVAESDVEILWINAQKALRTNAVLTQNMITDFAEKNLTMNRKILHMSRRTTAQKLMSYLYSYSKICGKTEFDIPLRRRQLADYLGVERSAMCNELSKLQKEGLISYKGSHFKITKPDTE